MLAPKPRGTALRVAPVRLGHGQAHGPWGAKAPRGVPEPWPVPKSGKWRGTVVLSAELGR